VKKNIAFYKLLLEKDITIKEIARQTGLSMNWIHKIANGIYPGHNVRPMIAKILKEPENKIWPAELKK